LVAQHGCTRREYWEKENQRRNQEAKERVRREQEDLRFQADIIKVGHRELSKQHHPDRGGDVTAQQKLNGARDALKKRLGH
jgi:hypothetical protein